jgi:hypothetical protein
MHIKSGLGQVTIALLLFSGSQQAGAMDRVTLGPAPKRFLHTIETPQFGRNWKVYIPGAAYQTENVVEGTRVLHTSAGANLPNNVLNIAANGTYSWTVDGRLIRGRWVRADKATLVLQHAYKGMDWSASTEKFGDDKVGHLLLSHENEQLKGR